MYGNDNCYDCSAPTVTAVQVSLDGSTPVTVTNDNAVQINAGNGDTVSVMVTVADNVVLILLHLPDYTQTLVTLQIICIMQITLIHSNK